jgi:hypothetical protein
LAHASGYTAFLTSDEAVLVPKNAKSSVLRLTLVNSRAVTDIRASELQPGTSNYISRGVTNVPNYGSVTYRGVYPGIDAIFTGNHRNLEYDFVVHPGADPSQIRLAYEGSRRFALDAGGNLQLDDILVHKPVVYQTIGGVRRLVRGEYVLNAAHEVGFALGEYDHSRPLTIDPTLSVFGNVGGAGNDEAFAVAANFAGVYITGRTNSADFPVQSALQGAHSAPPGNYDLFVTKLSADGSTLAYSTYLGQSGDDSGQGIAVDNAGNAYVTGYTNANLAGSPAPVVAFSGIYAAFVAKISPNGQSLLAQTYFGGNGSTQAFSIALDNPNAPHLAIGGLTTGLGLVPSGQNKSFGGGTTDGFLAKFDSSLNLTASTYLGGSNYDQVNGVAMDANGNVYAAGLTASGNGSGAGAFPTGSTGVSPANPPIPIGNLPAWMNTVGSVSAGTQVAFVTKMTADLNNRVYSSVFGAGGETANGIAVDPSGAAYVVGATSRVSFYPASNPTACAGVQPSQGGLPIGILVTGITGGTPIPGICGGDGATDPAGPLQTQGFLLALNPATPGSAIGTDGSARYLDLQPPSATTISPAGCNLVLPRMNTLGGVSNACSGGLFQSWNAVAADSDGQAYVSGQLDSAANYYRADYMRFGRAGASANGSGNEVIIDAGPGNAGPGNGNPVLFYGNHVSFYSVPVLPPGSTGSRNYLAYGVAVNALRLALVTGDTTYVSIDGSQVTGANTAGLTPGIAGLSSTSGHGGIDAFLAGIQYSDIIAAPSVVNFPAVAINSFTGSSGPTQTVALVNQFGIGTPCSNNPVIAPAGLFTITRVGATNTYAIQLAAGSTSTSGYLNATATFTCAGAENTETVVIRGQVGFNPTILYVTPNVATVSYNAIYGRTVTLSATLYGPQVSGKSINFTLGGIPVGSALTNASGTATLPGASLGTMNVGNYPAGIGASFGGDANDDPCSGTAVLQIGPAVPTGSVQSSANPSSVGTNVTFTVNVNDGAGLAAGDVHFVENGNTLQSVPVNTGACPGAACNTTSWTTSALPLGPHHIVGIFFPSNGNNNVAPIFAIDQSIVAVLPPAITNAFAASTVPLNGTVTLTFTIANPNPTQPFTGLGFSDTLPSGLLVSPAPNIVNGCGGSVVATAGTNAIAFGGGTLAAATNCQIKVDVKGVTAGLRQNTTSAITSNEAGSGSASNIAGVYVESAPVISTYFSVASIPLNGTATVTFVLANPIGNAVSLSGVSFNDTLPAGLIVSTPNGLTTSCFSGTITAAAASGSISATGIPVPANGSCQITVNVLGTVSGTMTNSTGAVTSTNGGTGNTATASILVTTSNALLPPVIAASFSPAFILSGQTTTLTFTITNPSSNTLPLTGLAFTANLPSGLDYTGPSNVGANCGGTLQTPPPQPAAFNGGVLQPGATCAIALGLRGNAVATYLIATSSIASSNAGSGNSVSLNFTVGGPPNFFPNFGVFRSTPGGLGVFVLDTDGNYNFDAADRFVSFGLSGDKPVAGNWGVGVLSLGVFRCPAAGVCQWYIDLNNNGKWDGTDGGDAIWNFGLPGDLPIVGDWTGDGISKIGVMRCPPAGSPGVCTWYLDAGNKHTYDPATVRIDKYGLPGDLPIAMYAGGPFGIGVFRCPAVGICTWIVDSNNNGQFDASDQQFSFGLAGDFPIVGNWFGSPAYFIGVFRNGAVLLNRSGDHTSVDFTGSFGLPGDLPVVGYWTLPPQ